MFRFIRIKTFRSNFLPPKIQLKIQGKIIEQSFNILNMVKDSALFEKK